MPKIDLDKIRWNRWLAEDPKPVWPEWLTKASWNKKKSLTSQAIETGLGEQLLVTERSFENAQRAATNFRPRNVDEVADAEENALAFIGGAAVRNLHEELKRLRQTAQTAVAKYKKSKAINLKATTQLAADIEEAADILMVCVNRNSLNQQLLDIKNQRIEEIHAQSRKNVGPTIKLCRGVPKKVLKEISTLQSNLDAMVVRELEGFGDLKGEDLALAQEAFTKSWALLQQDTGSSLHTCARDMTQPIANLRKARQAGVRLDNFSDEQIDGLLDILRPYGNGDAARCTGLDAEAIQKKIDVVRNAARAFKPFAEGVEVARI